MMTTLVLGIGNTLLTDEGAGIYVVERLRREHEALPGVTYLDGGTLSFALAESIENADNLIVVDAAELAAEPGTVRSFVGAEMDSYLGAARRSVHEVALTDLIDIARLTNSLPARRALVGIQPAELAWGHRPSEQVAMAIPSACRKVLELMHGWRVWAKSVSPSIGTGSTRN